MHLLITRPEPDASAMRDMLQAEGITADVAPLLEIVIDTPDAVLLARASVLVVTSRNGLRALERARIPSDVLSRPLLVVGRGTGEAARRMGFADVTVGPATAKDLLPLITAAWRERIVPAAGGADPGPVVHLSGDKLSFDLKPHLAGLGIPLVHDTVYRSQPVKSLPPVVQATLAASGYDGVVLMSPLTAETFVDLVVAKGLAEGARRAAYLCLSQGIADRVAPLGVRNVTVAVRPNIEEMVALIRDLAAKSAAMSPPGDQSDTMS